MRWFESGSIGSINLGSSMDIFREPVPQPKRSTIFGPWRTQSQHIIYALRLKSRRSSNQRVSIDEESESKKETKTNLSVPAEQDKMLEKTELTSRDNEQPSPDERHESKANSWCCMNICRWLVHFFDLDLLRDNIYLNIMIGMAISIFSETNFAILTPFILSDLDFTADEIAMILFTMAIADLISRFCSPFIADRLNLSIRVSYVISLVLLVLTRTCKNFDCRDDIQIFPFSFSFSTAMTLINGYTNMLIVCTALGIAKGIRSVYMCIVIPSYIPLERLASASAIQLFGNGIIMMCVGPILGL